MQLMNTFVMRLMNELDEYEFLMFGLRIFLRKLYILVGFHMRRLLTAFLAETTPDTYLD